MITKIIEATSELNWGKFLLGQFDYSEWGTRSTVDHSLMLAGRGHNANDTLVVDLQTCEGAIFTPGGLASADLAKHRIWVCPLFEPFLTWLYSRARVVDGRPRIVFDSLPDHVDLAGAPFAMAGYRRDGKVKCPTCQGYGKLCLDDFIGITSSCHTCQGKGLVDGCAACGQSLPGKQL